MRRFTLLLAALTLGTAATPAFTQADRPAPLAALIGDVAIPHEQFTLANGLRVLVHTDRKAPIVGVTVYYDVGSKHEPSGRTGFAHLFEHLMFGGSENVPNFDEPLVAAGSTPTNGSTWFDRTNYVETVPTGALDLALFMESDRMGHLLGAVSQEKLDAQRGVVQNEKRQGDNQPFGLVEYAKIAGTVPAGHPYGHSTIGSMADLDAASLDDVKGWFRQHYGPNNAILVLAGDIDAATARPLVEKYFGDIPRGPQQGPIAVTVPTLPKPVAETMKDRVANTRLYRVWTVPGLNDPDAVPLGIGATVLGGLASSRLDNALVREEKLAVAVSAYVEQFAQMGWFTVQADVKPGVDPALVGRRLDALIADLVANGPSADEVQRTAMRAVAGSVAGLENVGGFSGKGATLAEGLLYSGTADQYQRDLAAYAAATPEQVRAALGRWLNRPVYALSVVPGPRDAYQEAGAATGPGPRFYRGPDGVGGPAPAATAVDRSTLPPVAPVTDFTFPTVSRARLSNGIPIVYARRDAVPVTRMVLSFDAGAAADPAGRRGTQTLALALMEEGTTSRDSIAIAEAQERLGASIDTGASLDNTAVTLSTLSANLAPAVALFADVVRNPAFRPAEVDRLRDQQLAAIAAEMTSPAGLAARALPPLLFGADHPYGKPGGSGDPAAVKTLTRAELVGFHRAWIRPDKATLFVVSDRPLDEVRAALDAQFADWHGEGAPGTKNFAVPVPAPRERIVLIDRPDSPQSYIVGGEVTALTGSDDIVAVQAASAVLGDNFLSRLNMDLRETKGWSYGVSGRFDRLAGPVPYRVSAPVQADKTGPAIAALRQNIAAFLTDKGVTTAERDRTIEGLVRQLPSSFETGAAVLAGMQYNALFKRPDDYYSTLAGRYRALDAAAMDKAIRAAIDPRHFVWLVVGDAKTVRPQLDSLGLPVEVLAAK